jgi:hypothetical protein
MTVAGTTTGGKHSFVSPLDDEQVFVVGWRANIRSSHRRRDPMAAIAYPRPSPRVRRRRCQVVLFLGILLVAGVVWALGGVLGRFGSGPLAAPGPDPSRAVPVDAIVRIVQPGETVWSIARSIQPKGEVRPLVDRLEREVQGRPLQVGDRLVVN